MCRQRQAQLPHKGRSQKPKSPLKLSRFIVLQNGTLYLHISYGEFICKHTHTHIHVCPNGHNYHMSVFKDSELNNNSNFILWFTIIPVYIIPIIYVQNFGTVISPTILIFRFCSKEALIVPMAQVPSTSSSIAAQKTVGHRTHSRH